MAPESKRRSPGKSVHTFTPGPRVKLELDDDFRRRNQEYAVCIWWRPPRANPPRNQEYAVCIWWRPPRATPPDRGRYFIWDFSN